MSKRLRASMRAANKGRNLRPRASLPPQERASGAPPPGDLDSLAPDAADDVRDDGPETEDSSQAEMQGDAGAFKAPDETSSASTLRPEQIEARDAEAEARAREEAEQAARAQQEAAAKREAEAETQRRAEARLMAEAKAQREADAKAKQDADAKAKQDAEAKAQREAEAKAKQDAEAKAKAQREAEAKAKQDAEAKAKAQREADAKAKAKVDDKKAEASKKGATSKPEEKKGAKADQAPASTKKPVAMEASKPGDTSKPPARQGAKTKDDGSLDEEMDPSSVSAEFFRKDEDSVPPVEEVDEGSHQTMMLSPTTLARRARLRRLVAGVVAFAAVISIAVVGKTLAAPKRTTAPTTMLDSKREAPKTTAPTSKPAPVAEAPKVEPAKVEPAKVDEKKADEPAKVDEKKAAPSGGDAVALTKETESLLNRGKRKEAIDKAREAIAADPNAAMPYLLLGSALQDSGKWKDGIEAYSECVRHATKGPVHECRAMGGRK